MYKAFTAHHAADKETLQTAFGEALLPMTVVADLHTVHKGLPWPPLGPGHNIRPFLGVFSHRVQYATVRETNERVCFSFHSLRLTAGSPLLYTHITMILFASLVCPRLLSAMADADNKKNKNDPLFSLNF